MHLSYRYRAKMLMWWPSSTADIDIVTTPQAWGKRFWLELKTTEWVPSGNRHDLYIDLRQLADYGQQAVPDFYVFPVAPWDDVLSPISAAPWLAGTAPQRIAYESWSGDRWFARWTYVVPGWSLRDALRTKIAALPPGNKPRNVRVASVVGGVLAWRPAVTSHVPKLLWRDFWSLMENCGNDDWRAQFLLPPGAASTSPSTRAGLASDLLQLAANHKTFTGQAVTFDRTANDTYSDQSQSPSSRPDFNWEEGSRALVNLTEQAIRD